MGLFKKKQRKPSVEEKKKCDSLSKEAEKLYNEMSVMPDGSFEKGEKFRAFIRKKEEQYKIYCTPGDKTALLIVKQLYRTGLAMGKWKK